MEEEIIEVVLKEGYSVCKKTKTVSTIYRNEVKSESVRHLMNVFGYKLQLGMFLKEDEV